MTRNYYAPGKANPHLPHDAQELKPESTDTDSACRDADLLVSQLMTPEARAETLRQQTTLRRVEPVSEPVLKRVPEAETPPTTVAQEPLAKVKADNTPVELRDEKLVRQELRSAFPPLQEEEETPVKTRRANPVYIIAIACGVIVFFFPTLLFWMLVCIGASLLGTAALMRIPGVRPLASRAWQWFASRVPHRAERLRRLADWSAARIEGLLDLLPGSLADRLGLPDFSQPVAPKR